MSMQITITGCKQAPSWVSLQTVLRESLRDESMKFVKIRRTDRQIDHHAPGVYETALKNDKNEIRHLTVTVSG